MQLLPTRDNELGYQVRMTEDAESTSYISAAPIDGSSLCNSSGVSSRVLVWCFRSNASLACSRLASDSSNKDSALLSTASRNVPLAVKCSFSLQRNAPCARPCIERQPVRAEQELSILQLECLSTALSPRRRGRRKHAQREEGNSGVHAIYPSRAVVKPFLKQNVEAHDDSYKHITQGSRNL